MGEKTAMVGGFAIFIIIIALIVTVVVLLFPGETTEDKEIREMQEKIDKKISDADNKIKMSAERDAEQADEIMRVMEKGLKAIDETEERATVELTREAELQNFIKATLTDEEIEWLDFVQDTMMPKFNELMRDELELCESVYSRETYKIFHYRTMKQAGIMVEILENYMSMQETIRAEVYTEYGNIKELTLESSEITEDLGNCIQEKSDEYK